MIRYHSRSDPDIVVFVRKPYKLFFGILPSISGTDTNMIRSDAAANVGSVFERTIVLQPYLVPGHLILRYGLDQPIRERACRVAS